MSDLPEGWEYKSFEKANIIVTDGDRGKEYPKSSDFLENGFCLFLNAKNVTKNGFSFDECQFISEEKHNKLRKGVVKKGDIVLTTRGSVGHFAIFDNSVPYGCLRVNSGMVTLNCSDSNVDNFFFYLLCKSFFVMRQIDSLAFGSAQPQLTIKIIKKLKIPLPPLPEQRKIAQILSTWDKAIATTEKQIANSKQQKKALMQQLLTGKKRLAGFSGDWERYSLKELADIDKHSLGKNTPKDFRFEYISLSDVDVGTINKNLEWHVFSTAPSRARRIVKENDILLSTVRPNLKGFACVKTEHSMCVASTGFAVLTPKKNISNGYLYQYLFSAHITGQINSLVVGSNYPAINSSDVAGLKIYCPCYEEQQKIAQVLTTADNEISTLETQLTHLQQEKKALMQQLLTGKRRVVAES